MHTEAEVRALLVQELLADQILLTQLAAQGNVLLHPNRGEPAGRKPKRTEMQQMRSLGMQHVH